MVDVLSTEHLMALARGQRKDKSCYSTTHTTGDTPTPHSHCVLGFRPPDSESDIDTILNLSLLQFGDARRGFKGKGLFVLEPVHEYVKRLSKFAEGHNFHAHQRYKCLDTKPSPYEEWLEGVARKVKDRWENCHEVPWCGHCGAPPLNQDLKRCSRCHQVSYCNVEHQRAADAK
ncbi:hypothetical protein BDN70DRAFT_248369 [Pholiota conissans]|uniref:MYND-type domain-containing protein n=1 Tax=Pholiota conissans TaxID=109636 RepID=A0A9P5YU78_9AGAR|nr:hypothetical protein BDN70DRAFT_248369 [Pholiota conissans]